MPPPFEDAQAEPSPPTGEGRATASKGGALPGAPATPARRGIDELRSDAARAQAERDVLLHLLMRTTSSGPGRAAVRWQSFTREHALLARLLRRPSRGAWKLVTLRWPGGLWVNPLFDDAWYRERYPDAPRGRRAAWRQYRALSLGEGRDPNPYFDTDWYLDRNPDVRRGRQHPLDHYLDDGWRENRDPGPDFRGFEYLRSHPECLALGMNPLLHRLRGEADPSPPRVGWTRVMALAPARASALGRTQDFYRRYGGRQTLARIARELRALLLGMVDDRHCGADPIVDEVHPERIQAHLDVPQPGAGEGSSTLIVTGWACSRDGGISVELYVDRRPTSGLARPDVAARHVGLRRASEGRFAARVPLEGVEPGPHHLQVVVRDAAGNVRVVVCPFVRIEPESMYDGYYRRSLPSRDEVTAMRRWAAEATGLPEIHLIVSGAGDGLRATLASLAGQSYPARRCTVLVPDPASAEDRATAEDLKGVAEDLVTAAHQPGRAGRADAIQYVTDPFDLPPSAPHANRFLGFLRAGERLAPEALFAYAAEAVNTSTGIIYSDHDSVLPTGRHERPWFAPDWSPDHLLAQDYVGGVFLARDGAPLRGLLPGLLASAGPAWRYELLLTLSEQAGRIAHVPRVLWSAPLADDEGAERADAERAAVQRVLDRRGAGARVRTVHRGADGPVRHVEWSLDRHPRVSVIIPTTGQLELVTEIMRSLTSGTDYPDVEVVFLDNSRGRNPEGIGFLRQQGVTVLERDEPFNWARLNNVGARASSGELLLFLNDDMEAVDPGWMTELVRQAQRPDVGAVGALLLYPDGSIQHAGVFLVGHGGGAVHLFHQMDPAEGPYLGLHRVTREVTAVTGACLMVRRSVFDEVGGFDEDLAVVGNDIDLCLRLARLGRRTLWTPASRLVHHESLSRSGVSHLADEGRIWDRWADMLLTGDPHHGPHLAKDRVDCGIDWSRVAGRRDPVTEADPASGVNLVGYIRAEMGVGQATRGEAQALTDADVPFVIIDHHQGNPARMEDRTWQHRVVEAPVFDTNLLHINADVLPVALLQLPVGLRDGRRNIGYWTWELPAFPERWLGSFDLVDEVWVPSTFVRDAIGAVSPVPVHVVPHAVVAPPGPFPDREHLGLPADAFQLLAMYDTASVQQRKNPVGAVEAFRRAFGPTDPGVSLVLKVNNSDHRELAALRELVAERPNVHLITDTLSRFEMDALLAGSDIFVSLHRAEGFGLPIAEAMALGKPVVATGWSGNTDFMSAQNAACVAHRLVTLDRSYGPYDAGQTWAEPDLDDAAAWMRRLRDDPDLGRSLGEAARRTIAERHAPSVVGGIMKRLLAR